LVPASSLDGKEGVDGSSPSEGLRKPLHMSGFFGTFVDLFGDTRSHAGRTNVGICLFADDPSLAGRGRRFASVWGFTKSRTPGEHLLAMSTPGPTATATGLDALRARDRKHGLVGGNRHARDKEARPRDGVRGPKAEANMLR
jgi:hypothetical protein